MKHVLIENGNKKTNEAMTDNERPWQFWWLIPYQKNTPRYEQPNFYEKAEQQHSDSWELIVRVSG